MQQHENYNPYAPPTADVDQGLQARVDDYVLADRGTRLGAVLIDGLLSVASLLPGFVLLVALAGFDNLDPARMLRRMDDSLMFAGIAVMVLMALSFQIYQWYLISTTGQSLAKRWLGIKIVRLDGSDVGFVNGVILRGWVIGAIGNIPLVGGLIALINPLMIFGEERRCLHDHIAGTRVIVAPISQ
jgi:uncharacterized RDD family membrane protein YckC